MLPYFILGFALLIGLLLAVRWFAGTNTKVLARTAKRVALGLIMATIAFFAVTGRLNWAFLALPALLPWILRARAFSRRAKNFSRMAGGSGAPSGQVSEIATRFLRVTLDHDSGAIAGEVIDGPHAGRRLEDLGLDDLIGLLGICQTADEQSAQVLTAYLDRIHPDWRVHAQPGGGGSGDGFANGPMSRDEALQILGLEPDAGPDAIKEAHRRLMAGLHPDHGGSTYLAAKLNEAKELLLDT
ncbi:MAG: hypothetical protein QGF38_11150 [Rhodospirillales bacterium]|nr:hypothetical protein [Rhodospirillales bacterium]HJO96643.1 hypothetical protein [Rhodospirillales bacterium]